jgi:hypothetical protein
MEEKIIVEKTTTMRDKEAIAKRVDVLFML